VKPALDFFLFYGSLYTYLAVMRIEAAAGAAGLDVRWRPFNLREILVEQNNTGFARNKVRMNYMWRDIERRARRHALPFNGRVPHPVDPDLLALRVGTVAAAEGWCADYTRATFDAWFTRAQVPGLVPNVEAVLSSLGRPVDAVMARASSPEIAETLARETAAAREAGIFGSPSVVANGELFWGDDRLEEAIDWMTQLKRGAGTAGPSRSSRT
jgi:2-hydroxychromene-2-carboxylate isomerase